jgi:DNA-binding HxlR family transcriptional regulator
MSADLSGIDARLGDGWAPGTGGWQDVDASQCSIAHAADVIGDRWSLLLLREIALGVDRFDGMQAHLSASRRTMADRLDALVRHGVVERVPHKEPGQRVRHRYRLTAAGEDLRPLLQALGDWGAKHRPGRRRPPRDGVAVRLRSAGPPGAALHAGAHRGAPRRAATGTLTEGPDPEPGPARRACATGG